MKNLDHFYELMRTPVVPGEVISSPCTLPKSTTASDRRTVANRFGLELPIPSTTSVVGFVVMWILVGALIGGFVWIVS